VLENRAYGIYKFQAGREVHEDELRGISHYIMGDS